MRLIQSKVKDLMATITIDVVGDDYSEKVDKALKDYRKTAVIPGFRKGKGNDVTFRMLGRMESIPSK